MKLSPAIQECLLAILFYGSPGDRAQVLDLVPLTAYDLYYREAAEEAARFAERFGAAPGEHTMDLFRALEERNEKRADGFRRVADSMEQTWKAGINRAYVLEQAGAFARRQNLRRALAEALDLAESGTDRALDEAEDRLREALVPRAVGHSPGLRLADAVRSLSFLETQQEFMPTGIPELDAVDCGPFPGGLHVFMAPPTRGKSWYLTNLGLANALRGRRVLHVTLEMSEAKVAARYVQTLARATKRKARRVAYRVFTERDERGRPLAIGAQTEKVQAWMAEKPLRKALSLFTGEWGRVPPVMIKGFPSGSATVDDIRRHLDMLESRERWMPSLVIVDYADLFKMNPDQLRLDTGRAYVNLRGLGQERNVAMATASQCNRDGDGKVLLTRKNLAEDYSKVMTADQLITYNQTTEERRYGTARLFVDKNREDETGRLVMVSQAYEIGQFRVDSALMPERSYWDVVKSEDADDDEEPWENAAEVDGGPSADQPRRRERVRI